MNTPFIRSTLILISAVCAGCGDMAMSVANQRVGGIHSTKCDGYEQSKSSVEALIKYAQELEIQGKITRDKLIDVDQEAGLYSQKLTSACRFFTAGDINFQQYQEAVERADNAYRLIRESLPKASSAKK